MGWVGVQRGWAGACMCPVPSRPVWHQKHGHGPKQNVATNCYRDGNGCGACGGWCVVRGGVWGLLFLLLYILFYLSLLILFLIFLIFLVYFRLHSVVSVASVPNPNPCAGLKSCQPARVLAGRGTVNSRSGRSLARPEKDWLRLAGTRTQPCRLSVALRNSAQAQALTACEESRS